MIKIYPSTISGRMNAPASKAHAQRLFFMASMPAHPTRIKNVPRCNDIDTTVACLETLGCQISKNATATEYVVSPFPKTSPMPDVALNFKESATTARIAMVLCAALGIKADCKATGTLLKRLMIQLTGRLALRGITFSNFSLPLLLTGRLNSGEYIFAGDEGSQSISAVMMFTPCLLGDSSIRYETPLIDKSYIEITRKAMDSFGVHIEETENGFNIPGRQFYQSPKEITVENDWSLSAMWIAAAAASGSRGTGLVIDKLNAESDQMYRDLEKINAFIYQDFEYFNVDASKSPNLATVYAAMAIVKGASISISNVPQLKFKETNRLSAMGKIAELFGQKAIVSTNSIEIIGNKNPQYPKEPIDCFGDPWVFMSMVLASTKAKEEYTLLDEHGANKVYRDFLADFESLGGKYEIV